MKQRFPKAKFLGVANSGAAPLEDVMAKRADAAPINRIPYVPMSRKVKELAVLPRDNNCQDSTEKARRSASRSTRSSRCSWTGRARSRRRSSRSSGRLKGVIATMK